MSDVHDSRELWASGKHGIFDADFYLIDLFEEACCDAGIYFFKSLTDIILQSPSDKLDSLLETLELDVFEMKRWLDTNDILPEFFFPDKFDGHLAIKAGPKAGTDVKDYLSIQHKRELVLSILLEEHGEAVLKDMKRIDVWALLTNKDKTLFPLRTKFDDSTVKKFFDGQEMLSFSLGRKGQKSIT